MDEYVARMVEVFREVRRVLRDDGTLWLNLGDSYASGIKGSGGRSHSPLFHATTESGRTANGRVHCQHFEPRKVDCGGLAPKQLLGIPWRVAFALQQPYYTGSIRDERDRIWLAAMLDAEGCMFIHKRKAGQSNGQDYTRANDTFSAGIEIANTSPAVIDRIAEITGKGSVCSQSTEDCPSRKQTIYRWNLRAAEAREFVCEIYPHLVAKKHQARILCGCPSSGERAEAGHEALKALHHGSETDVDFPDPGSMFEPGFYLRSDIVWAKPNPMPESVRDRPTKSHEYLFLLSKSPRYFYDADAVREPNAREWVGGNNGANKVRLLRGTVNNKGNPGLRETDPNPLGRNCRSVWTVATRSFKGAHFATFPPKLIEPCILAGCPVGGTVLDPFAGAFTTGVVAKEHGRSFVGIELNPEYLEMGRERLASTPSPLAGMFVPHAAGLVEADEVD